MITTKSSALRELDTSKRKLIKIAFWGNLICQIGIIVTGGVVRLSKSGLGCSTWPSCEPGQFVPVYHPDSGLRPFIEFGNRALTVVLVVFALAVLVLSWRYLKPKGKGFLTLAVVPLFLTIVQALVGALVVFLHLDPALVSIHFIVSPILIAASTILVYRLYEADNSISTATHKALRYIFWPLSFTGFGVIILGTIVTGSGPHSGDANAPSRFPFNPAEIAWLHADAVWLFAGLLLAFVLIALVVPTHRITKLAMWILVSTTALQALIGYLQYFNDLPEILVGFHMLGAALFTAALAFVGSSLFTWQETVALNQETQLIK